MLITRIQNFLLVFTTQEFFSHQNLSVFFFSHLLKWSYSFSTLFYGHYFSNIKNHLNWKYHLFALNNKTRGLHNAKASVEICIPCLPLGKQCGHPTLVLMAFPFEEQTGSFHGLHIQPLFLPVVIWGKPSWRAPLTLVLVVFLRESAPGSSFPSEYGSSTQERNVSISHNPASYTQPSLEGWPVARCGLTVDIPLIHCNLDMLWIFLVPSHACAFIFSDRCSIFFFVSLYFIFPTRL